MADVHVVTVFAEEPGGGNPAPVVLDAGAMSDDEMREVARAQGHESAFVVDAAGTDCDLALRFWVPHHEMEMCAHATVGTVWLLGQRGLLPHRDELRIRTRSGVVRARVAADGSVQVSQPVGRLEAVDDDEVLDVLGLARTDLADRRLWNATTSRTKTLVPVRDVAVLDALTPDLDRVEGVCERLGSTGLYPYAPSGDRRVDARQFPRSSGYPEDPATGIAAAALAFGILADGLVSAAAEPIVVRQGRAMGRPSRITVHLDVDEGTVSGCWVGGPVSLSDATVER